MNIISQTNRTLLLEEFNPEKLDLLTLIGDVKGIDSLSDDKIKEINQHLECRSYEEFQEKFAPCIYSFFDANSQAVKYTLKKPESKGFIHTAGLTDLHIRIAAECVDHQVGCQRGAAPQAFRWLDCIAIRIKLFVNLPGFLQQVFGIYLDFHNYDHSFPLRSKAPKGNETQCL